MIANDKNERYPDVYRMDTKTGRKTFKSWDKPGDVTYWVADRDGAVRAALTIEKGTIQRFYWRPGEDAKWILQREYGLQDPMIRPIAFDGEAGYQAELLMPGLRWMLWPLYAVQKLPWVQVPAGEIGVVIVQHPDLVHIQPAANK